MTNRITLPQFHAVRKMLAASRRHCEIDRETGLSVWTIGQIAGDLKVAGALRVPSAQSPDELAAEEEDGTRSVPTTLPEDDAPPDYDALKLRRCTGCGGMVYQWPCRTCLLRSHGTPLSRS